MTTLVPNRRTKKIFSLLLLVFAIQTAGDGADASDAAKESNLATLAGVVDSDTSGIEVDKYALKLSVDPARRQIQGIATIAMRYPDAKTQYIRFDMAAELYARSVSIDGENAQFSHDAEYLTISIPAGVRDLHESDSHPLLIAIEYSGTPDGGFFSFDRLNETDSIANYGLPYSARHWFPCFDTPFLKAHEMFADITVPNNLFAVSNGSLIGVDHVNESTSTFHWHEKYPIYADVVSIAAADYKNFSLPYSDKSGRILPLDFYLFAQDIESARRDFSVVPKILSSYEDLLGPYPFPGEKYGIAEFSRNSFREHQTLPSLGRKFITGRNENWWIIAHEIAHQWFGNAVSVESWSDVWLNESFAQYSVALWQEREEGAVAYHAFMKKLWANSFAGSVYVADPRAINKMFGDTTFGKGTWALHMLRHVMGDANFLAALKTYISERRYGHATTATWQAICERYFGKPLNWFFKEWIYETGQPVYRIEWTRRSADQSAGYLLTLTQTQEGTIFKMPIDLSIHYRSGATRTTIWMDQRTQSFPIDTPDEVVAVEVDPDDWVLKGIAPD